MPKELCFNHLPFRCIDINVQSLRDCLNQHWRLGKQELSEIHANYSPISCTASSSQRFSLRTTVDSDLFTIDQRVEYNTRGIIIEDEKVFTNEEIMPTNMHLSILYLSSTGRSDSLSISLQWQEIHEWSLDTAKRVSTARL